MNFASHLCKFLIAMNLVCFSLITKAGIFDNGVFQKLRVGEFLYEISAHEIKQIGVNRNSATVQLPYATNAVLRYFRPNIEKGYSYTVDTGIGPVFLDGNLIWFGLDFYSGEGSVGIGGVGFLDTRTMRLGLLRHPALVGCAIREIAVNKHEIIVDTYYFGEYAQGYCSGRVAIDRNSLVAQICDEVQDVKAHKKDEAEYPLTSPNAQGNSKTLVCQRKKPGPQIDAPIRKRLESVGLERLMLEQTDFERDWFAEAARRGEVVFDQHCTIEPGKDYNTGVCTTPSVNEHGIKSSTLQGLGNYKCKPDGFGEVRVITREVVAHGVEASVYPKGRLRYANNEVTQQYPIATAGMTWTQYTYGLLDILVLEGVKIVNSVCSKPFQWLSGPAIHTANFWLRVLKVDQEYKPAGLK